MPRELTIKEEIQILKELRKHSSYLDNGSSRIVYTFNDGFVYKVAFDEQGQFQNRVEVDNFKTYGNEYLAKIKTYGKYIVVMEEVEVIPYDFLERLVLEEEMEYYDDHEILEEFGFSRKVFEQAEETYEFLEGVNGHTYDNIQLGLAGDRVVSFDYGYISGEQRRSVSPNLPGIIDLYDYQYHEIINEILGLEGKIEWEKTDKKRMNYYENFKS